MARRKSFTELFAKYIAENREELIYPVRLQEELELNTLFIQKRTTLPGSFSRRRAYDLYFNALFCKSRATSLSFENHAEYCAFWSARSHIIENLALGFLEKFLEHGQSCDAVGDVTLTSPAAEILRHYTPLAEYHHRDKKIVANVRMKARMSRSKRELF